MTVHVGNVGVDVSVELGRKMVTVDEVRPIQVGDTIAFDKLAGEGEVVVVADMLAVRLTRLIVRTDPS